MTKPDTRPTIHIKLDDSTLAKLNALAARDDIPMTTWVKATIREQFRKMSANEQARWLKQEEPR